MRQEPNNGIDLLLRQMGRREESLSVELDAQHLDADEMSSYVANALPPAARARYTRHLADCSSCRKIVAQLSASEAVVAVQQPVSIVEPTGLKSFLASLFSPMVLRFAVPALGLIVVAAIGIVVLRQENPLSNVAKLEDTTDQNKSVLQDQTPVVTATPPPAQPPISKKPAAPAAANVETQQPLVASEAPPPAPAPKATPAEEPEQQPEPAKQKLETKEAEVNVARDARRDEDSAKREQRQADDVAAANSGPAAAPGSKVAEPQRAKAAEVLSPLSSAPKSEAGSSRPRKDGGVATFSSGETKTVSGRTFQKRGELWVDTAYGSYRSITNVARGSEQYRALVADEPDIQTIADTLKSEFIVVWKGRAYRVR